MNRIKGLFNLDGKVAIITGASKGIGESMARGLAEFGAKVVVSSRKLEAVEEVANEIRKDGFEAIAMACHVADQSQQKNLVEKVIEKYGRVDILINNAGTNPFYGPIETMTDEVYQKTLDINLNAPMQLSNLVVPYMRKTGGGSIIHISSIEGLHATSGFAAYNLSKAGLIMLTQNQAAEWGKDNIRVNAICPGLVKTKLSYALWADEKNLRAFEKNIPLGRMAMADEMAGLAVFLASGASSYMTGSIIVNDGGILHAPIMS